MISDSKLDRLAEKPIYHISSGLEHEKWYKICHCESINYRSQSLLINFVSHHESCVINNTLILSCSHRSNPTVLYIAGTSYDILEIVIDSNTIGHNGEFDLYMRHTSYVSDGLDYNIYDNILRITPISNVGEITFFDECVTSPQLGEYSITIPKLANSIFTNDIQLNKV